MIKYISEQEVKVLPIAEIKKDINEAIEEWGHTDNPGEIIEFISNRLELKGYSRKEVAAGSAE